jgi:mannan endo-1,4-beta-mannosidase
MESKSNARFLLIFLAFCFYGVANGQLRFEAEQATYSSGLKVSNTISGYSGSGYVGNFANSNDKLIFKFSLGVAAEYNLSLGVAAPYGNKTNFISVNGNKLEFSILQSATFSEKQLGKVRLIAGENIVEVTPGWGWFFVDYLSVDPNTGPAVDFNLTETLVNPNSTENTRKLYQFLRDNFRKKIISGVMTLESFDETNWIKQQTGKEPALAGIDFMHCNRGYTWYNNNTPVNDVTTWYDKNGIPALCWHWRDPSRVTEAFYTSETSFDVSKIFDENSSEYKTMISDIDYIAGLLKQLSDNNVPVLWRPLHEASGGWFWWGAKGAGACKRLWQIMFDRMVNYHQTNNLIWIWTADTHETNMDWYPGDEYVDILGVDIYAEKGDFSSQYLVFDKIKTDFEGKKMVTLSECGIVLDPDNLENDQAGWSYFMSWYGDFVRDGIYNPLSHWQKVMNHEHVITLDEMPDLKEYVTVLKETNPVPEENFAVSIDYLHRTLQINPINFTGDFDLEIYTLNGNLCYSEKKQNGKIRILLSELPEGFVVVVLRSPEKVFRFKVII